MKNIKFDIVSTALLLVIAVLLITLINTCNRQGKVIDNIKSIAKISNSPITYKKDIEGTVHAEKQLAVADISILKEQYYKYVIDSITKRLSVKEKQLLSFTGISTIDTGSVKLKIDTTYIDSIPQTEFEYNDKWVSFKGYIGKSDYLEYSIYDSLGITVYQKNKGLFKNSVPIINVYSLNPKVKIAGLTGFSIPVKQPSKFGLGAYIGYGWNGNSFSPSIGLSLTYTLIRF